MHSMVASLLGVLLACVASVAVRAQDVAAFALDTAATARSNGPVGLNDTVTVILQAAPNCRVKGAYALLLDGMPTGIVDHACIDQDNQRQLTFLLTRSPDAVVQSPNLATTTAMTWRMLLRYPWRSPGMQRDVRLALQYTGSDGVVSASSNSATISLKMFSWNAADITAIVIVTLTLLGLVWPLLRRGNAAGPTFLRNTGVHGGGPLPSYSLARVQMAWWFGLIYVAYVFLWMVTSEPPAMTSSALWLMGISGTTGLASAVIDRSSNAPVKASKGFIDDLTSESNGTGLHRFQLVAWTVFFGLVFMVQVFSTMAIPDFDASILGLMGISAGTYLGFKSPAAKADSATPAPADSAGSGDADADHKAAYTVAQA